MDSTPRPPAHKFHKYGYVAEIISSPSPGGELFHYVVQQEGSSGIVHWGQETSYERAMESIEDFLSKYQAKRA